MDKQRYSQSLSSEEFEAAYIKYACNEVTHNTMTRGEFAYLLETNKEFANRFVPNYLDNTFDWSYNNESEIK
jgi:hypothetical protein